MLILLTFFKKNFLILSTCIYFLKHEKIYDHAVYHLEFSCRSRNHSVSSRKMFGGAVCLKSYWKAWRSRLQAYPPQMTLEQTTKLARQGRRRVWYSRKGKNLEHCWKCQLQEHTPLVSVQKFRSHYHHHTYSWCNRKPKFCVTLSARRNCLSSRKMLLPLSSSKTATQHGDMNCTRLLSMWSGESKWRHPLSLKYITDFQD